MPSTSARKTAGTVVRKISRACWARGDDDDSVAVAGKNVAHDVRGLRIRFNDENYRLLLGAAGAERGRPWLDPLSSALAATSDFALMN